MATTDRKTLDCRQADPKSGCSLTISGSEQEVMDVAKLHAIQAHGMQDSPQLKDHLRQFIMPADDTRAAA